MQSNWYILDPRDDSFTPVKQFDFSGHGNLRKFADYEMEKSRAYATEPPHIRLMQQLELVDYEPGSDKGNMRYYPKGRLVKHLLERYVTETVARYGAVEVETPIMYDYNHPALSAYLNRFPARHYTLKSDEKEFFLRFSADFGQFLLIKDANISYRHLPFKFYELTRYSFRREQSGELVGLKRLRSFTMPDMHTLCGDIGQAKEEFHKQFDLCRATLEGIGIPKDSYEIAIRFTEDFFKNNKEFITSIAREGSKPALIETWNFRYAYFDPKFEFNVIDSVGKATALSTVQVDHENGERYGITYTNEQGAKVNPILLHNSPSGAIERVIYALLEMAHEDSTRGVPPTLPLWLSPTQVRLIPVSERNTDRCVELGKILRSNDIRADVDDNNSTVSKRVRNAEREWVPYTVIMGDRESESGSITVRMRAERRQEEMGLERLVQLLRGKIGDKPSAALSLPELLSRRPTFK